MIRSTRLASLVVRRHALAALAGCGDDAATPGTPDARPSAGADAAPVAPTPARRRPR